MKLRLFFIAWFAGLPGIVAVALLTLPALVAGHSLPVPLWIVQIASAAQSALLLALAVFAGVALAPRVGLAAPVLSAVAAARPAFAALRRQLIPGLIGGLLGAALLWLFARHVPHALAPLQARLSTPPAVRLLYGGITEELLLRWGFMTLLAWLFWRVFQGGAGTPSRLAMWAAIGASALAFGAGHLPIASALFGPVPSSIVLYIVGANAAFGVVAGYLYWRCGLESAMLAHLLAHAVFLAGAP